MADIKDLGDGKFKIQVGKVLTTYTINADHTVSILGKDGKPNTFVFDNSDIEIVYLIGKMLLSIAKECRKDSPRPEIELGGHKYILAEEGK